LVSTGKSAAEQTSTVNQTAINTNLEGTIWGLDWFGINDVKFMRGGILAYMDDGSIKGTWRQEGTKVILTVNDYSSFEGYFINNELIEGIASNKDGKSGRFEMRKK
jgi:hypothetical protein